MTNGPFLHTLLGSAMKLLDGWTSFGAINHANIVFEPIWKNPFEMGWGKCVYCGWAMTPIPRGDGGKM